MEHKAGKHVIFLTTSYDLYIGNQTGAEMVIGSQELFGFNLGNFEQRAIEGVVPKSKMHFWISVPPPVFFLNITSFVGDGLVRAW